MISNVIRKAPYPRQLHSNLDVTFHKGILEAIGGLESSVKALTLNFQLHQLLLSLVYLALKVPVDLYEGVADSTGIEDHTCRRTACRNL